ncbi:MAG: hypothetical protein ACI81A_002820, partial [Paraglaciecola sp.]
CTLNFLPVFESMHEYFAKLRVSYVTVTLFSIRLLMAAIID